MNKKDALSILNIKTDYDSVTVKQAYRRACSEYHPDRNPAGADMMKLVNEAYETLKDTEGKAEGMPDLQSYGQDIFKALSAVMGLGFEIEVCGAWVWVHGDTKPHKEILKENGFRWAPKKKLWYFRPEDYKSYSRGKLSMDEIRERHGSNRVDNGYQARLTA